LFEGERLWMSDRKYAAVRRKLDADAYQLRAATMKVPNSRAAIRKYELSRTGEPVPLEKYGKVHAVLLRDPAQLWARYDMRRFELLKSATAIEDRRDAPQAACGLRVQYVYPMPWDDDQSDACSECKALIAYLALDPKGYPLHARAEHQRIREQRRLWWEQRQAREAERTAAERLLEAVDKQYDEPPELKNITERANQAKPDKSDTA
jgi:hypothetical protein